MITVISIIFNCRNRVPTGVTRTSHNSKKSKKMRDARYFTNSVEMTRADKLHGDESHVYFQMRNKLFNPLNTVTIMNI